MSGKQNRAIANGMASAGSMRNALHTPASARIVRLVQSTILEGSNGSAFRYRWLKLQKFVHMYSARRSESSAKNTGGAGKHASAYARFYSMEFYSPLGWNSAHSRCVAEV